MTRASVLARVWFAVVDIEFAVLALEALVAVAQVRVDQVDTGGSVLTRL